MGKSINEMMDNIFDKLSDTKRMSIDISVKEVDKLSVTDSKFAGCPYIPKSVANIPYGTKKNYLKLLAQFNLEQLPKGSFPVETGILQFFIDMNDEVCGANFDNGFKGEGCKVLYYPTIEEALTEEEVKKLYDDAKEEAGVGEYEECSPVVVENGVELALVFECKERVMSIGDHRFENLFCSKWNEEYPDMSITNFWSLHNKFTEEDGVKIEEYYDKYAGYGHKLLGYPEFAQYDPRFYTEEDDLEKAELLFQMDSEFNTDTKYEICWGDAGIANFFITKEYLEKGDFSRVWYSWDCS